MRKQIFVRIANPEVKYGYIPKLNAGLQVYLGNAVVSHRHVIAHLYAINSSDEDISLVYTEYLIRVLTSNFLLNYLNFGIVFKEWCSKLVQYASR